MNLRAPIFVFLAAALSVQTTLAQHRDHLTEQEVNIVRDTQELDKRIDVFIKAADRRLLSLNGGQTANAKQLKKDAELWGDLPTGTQAELIADIAGILDEAISKIDDVSDHDQRNPLIPKALRNLAAAVERIVSQVTPLRDQVHDAAEAASFSQLMENAESILEAANKLPPPTDKKKDKSDKNKPGG